MDESDIKEYAVRGHLCDGLLAFQRRGGGCTPCFGENGQTNGCDDTNYLLLIFCPFCGVKLPEPAPLAPWMK